MIVVKFTDDPKQKLIEELDDLEEKIIKLERFMHSVKFEDINLDDRFLIEQQYNITKLLAAVIAKRLNLR